MVDTRLFFSSAYKEPGYKAIIAEDNSIEDKGPARSRSTYFTVALASAIEGDGSSNRGPARSSRSQGITWNTTIDREIRGSEH